MLGIVERKLKVDDTCAEYRCELLHRDSRLVVIRFRFAGTNEFRTPVPIPAGSVSLGFYWWRRPYGVYRMRTAAGSWLADRLEAVADVRFDGDVLLVRDLILDWWFLPDGRCLEEDRQEFDEAVRRGLLAPRLVAMAQRAERVARRPERLRKELARLERVLALS